MSGKLPIDRARERDRANQAKKDRAKQRVTQDQATVEDKARAFDDEAAKRALEAGESRLATTPKPAPKIPKRVRRVRSTAG